MQPFPLRYNNTAQSNLCKFFMGAPYGAIAGKEHTMHKRYQTLLALLCAAAFLVGSNRFAVSAEAAGTDEVSKTASVVLTCTEVPLYIDDIDIGSGIVIDDVAYIPLLAFTECMLRDKCSVEWEQDSETARISSELLDITLTIGEGYMTANERCIYLEDGAYNINGTIVVPLRKLAWVFSLEPVWDGTTRAIYIDSSGSEIIASGAEFYDAADLDWLSRVIYSEAGNQPLAGMIGVGNVVLNRVADESGAFGDTVYDVIFQEGQFDVVSSGAIYLEPTERAVSAAKLCLEGCNTVGESKWFVNPALCQTGWLSNQTLAYIIGDHNFYA